MSRDWTASAALLSTLACGSVDDLGAEAETLASLEVRLAGPPLTVRNLRVGVLWAASPIFVPFCHEHGPTPLDPGRQVKGVAAAGCRDPFEFVPERLGPSVLLVPGETSVTISFERLPSPEVLVGPLESRIAYGSVVVFEDLDGNGDLDLRRGCGLGSRGPDSPRERRRAQEPILASSFTTLTAPQDRLVYLEGQFDADSNFYPGPSNCLDRPRPGFSRWLVGGLLDEGAECKTEPLAEGMDLRVGDPSAFENLACTQSSRESFSRPPRSRLEDVLFECTDDGSIAVAEPECDCPDVRVLSLRGCFDDAACSNPDWDLTNDVPEWWPCEVEPRRP
ncbi:MAG: hypothetical protein HY791_06945 [Deltaproteobacteria bacterium]|nr:hypothetical protein [Deltaproteobacteria bacterium]